MVEAGGGHAPDDEQEEGEREEIEDRREEEHAVEREEHDAHAAEPCGQHAADAACAGRAAEGRAALSLRRDAGKAFLEDGLESSREQEEHRAGGRQQYEAVADGVQGERDERAQANGNKQVAKRDLVREKAHEGT